MNIPTDKVEIMQFIADNYCFDEEIEWDANLNFFVVYEDLFVANDHGRVPLDINTLPEFQKAIDDTDDCFGFLLYCCRQMNKSPYGETYKTHGIPSSFMAAFKDAGN
jgi:hypothetical protein